MDLSEDDFDSVIDRIAAQPQMPLSDLVDCIVELNVALGTEYQRAYEAGDRSSWALERLKRWTKRLADALEKLKAREDIATVGLSVGFPPSVSVSISWAAGGQR